MNFKNNDTAIAYLWKWIEKNWYDAEVYAYGNGFIRSGNPNAWYYKTIWFTPKGAIRFDTGGAFYLTRKEAKRIYVDGYALKQYPMVRTHPRDIIENWRKKPPGAYLHPLAESLAFKH